MMSALKVTQQYFAHNKQMQRNLVGVCNMQLHVSITSMFYTQLFHAKVFWAAFSSHSLALKFSGTKAAHKILMKLTTGVNFRPIVSMLYTLVKVERPLFLSYF